jgi:hypothetical protein
MPSVTGRGWPLAERAEIVPTRSNGLTAEEAGAIETFAAEIRAGIAGATPMDGRALYEQLNIRGVIYVDPDSPDSVLTCRKYRFRIDWTGANLR